MTLTICVDDGGYQSKWTGSIELLSLARQDYGKILLTLVNHLASRVSRRKAMEEALKNGETET